jgi:diphosphomevalonate decarboxylase
MTDATGPTSRAFTAVAPSNIALVKYWGKRDEAAQWPANDSLSMTLSESRTITTARRSSGGFDSFTMAGQMILSHENGDHKIFRHLNRLRESLNVTGRLEIISENTFPTGCGIASSASGFAALTLASAAALTGESAWDALATRGASRAALANWARMGSGSAGRSLLGGFTRWNAGENPDSQTINNEFSSDHWDLADVIVVLSSAEKHTSSTEAHRAAWGSPLFAARLAGIPDRLKLVTQAIRERDLAVLGREIETDAMEMHAVAMSGSPAINYFSEDTARFTAWTREQRRAGRLPAWFTIDAGPNVHLICRQSDASDIAATVRKEWKNAKLIMDRVGKGPTIEVAKQFKPISHTSAGELS